MHKGETPEQAARREVMEEVATELGRVQLWGIYSNFEEFRNDHTVLFFSDDFTLGDGHDREVAELRFFRLDELPAGLRAGHRQKLEEYARNPGIAGGSPVGTRFGLW